MLSLSAVKEKPRHSPHKSVTALPSLRKKERALSHGGRQSYTARSSVDINSMVSSAAYKFPPMNDYDCINTYMNAAQNMTSTSGIQSAIMRRNRDTMFECRDMINKYKKDVKQMEQDWHNNMDMTIASIHLRMKEFTGKLKAQLNFTDNEYHMLKAEGNNVQRGMNNLANNTNQAERRTKNLENFSGVSAKVFATEMDEKPIEENPLE